VLNKLLENLATGEKNLSQPVLVQCMDSYNRHFTEAAFGMTSPELIRDRRPMLRIRHLRDKILMETAFFPSNICLIKLRMKSQI